MAKQKYETPVGTLEYVIVSGKGKLKLEGDETNPLDYEYSANLKLDDPKLLEQVQKDINDFWRKAKEAGDVKKAKPDWSPIKALKNEETDEPILGTEYFHAKTVANWKDKQSGEIRKQIIPVYDGIGNNIRQKLISKNILIGNGSEGIIYCTLTTTKNTKTKKEGITAYLEAIQLAKLEPYKVGEVDKSRLKKLDNAEALNLDEYSIEEEQETANTTEERQETANTTEERQETDKVPEVEV